MHSYLISGLHVSSELELPGAIPEPPQTSAADVSIRRGPVPMALERATASGPTWEVAGEIFLLRVPRMARFGIAAGREIIVEIEPGVSEHDAAGSLVGAAFGILLHQRGAIVLHGAAVAKDGRAVAICGSSGAGKSTLAAALCVSGCSFVTDDICVVGLDAQRRPLVLPDGKQLKLWKESIDLLDLADRRGEPVHQTFAKYYVYPSNARVPPTLLSAIYVLRDASSPPKMSINALTLPDALRALDCETYHPGLRAHLGNKPETLGQAAAVLGHTKVFLLLRPRGFEHLQNTVAVMQAHWDALD